MGRAANTMTRRAKVAFSKPLLERFQTGDGSSVDREAGVIRSVKLIGPNSSNGRKYTLEALKKAVPLYENAPVNCDHPSRADDQRGVSDRLGKIVNVRFTEKGLYGDLILLKSHPMTERVYEAAEDPNKNDLFGFSHNAQGSGRTENGVYVIEDISEVLSIDLVSRPASTAGLFESERKRTMSQVKVVDFLESVAAKLPRPKRIKLLSFLEDDMPGDAMIDEPAPPASGDADWRASLASVVSQLAATEDAKAHEIAAKIMKLLKPDGEAAAPVEEEDEDDPDREKVKEGEDEDDDKKKVKECDDDKEKPMEGKQRKGKPLSALDAIALCEDAGVSYDRTLLECLCLATNEEARKRIVDREKRVQAKIVQESGKVRTQKPGASTLTESNDGPTTWAKLAESRNGVRK